MTFTAIIRDLQRETSGKSPEVLANEEMHRVKQEQHAARLPEMIRNSDAALARRTPQRFIDVVFNGPPGHESGRFVEVEDESGASISVGEWVERPGGMWALRIPR